MLDFLTISGSPKNLRFFINFRHLIDDQKFRKKFPKDLKTNYDHLSTKVPLILLANETKLPQKDSKVNHFPCFTKFYFKGLVKAIFLFSSKMFLKSVVNERLSRAGSSVGSRNPIGGDKRIGGVVT